MNGPLLDVNAEVVEEEVRGKGLVVGMGIGEGCGAEFYKQHDGWRPLLGVNAEVVEEEARALGDSVCWEGRE